MKVYGELVRAQLEILTSDPSAAAAGRIWFNSSSNDCAFDNGSSVARFFDSRHSLIPATTSNDLGSSGARFANLYLSNIGTFGATNGTGTHIFNCAQVNLVGGTASDALLNIQVADASAGDPGMVLAITGVQSWHAAVDNSDSDVFSIGASATVGSNQYLRISTAGTVTLSQNLIISGLTATTVPYVNSAKQFTSSAVTPTELGYVSGVTSAIQTQINNLGASTVSTKSGSAGTYTVLDNDAIGTFLINSSSSDRTITLPTAADNTNRKIVIKKTDSGAGKVIVDGEGAETIDGSATFNLVDQDDFIQIQCDGSGWLIIDKGIGSRGVSSVVDMFGAGLGTVTTHERRIETNIVNTGHAITRTISSANGNSYLINQSAIYEIYYKDVGSTAGFVQLGISRNLSSGDPIADTTSVDMLDVTQISPTVIIGPPIHFTGKLNSGDVIRPHAYAFSGATSPTDASPHTRMVVSKIGI